MMKKLEEAIKKFTISVSPNNLGYTSGINPNKVWISPNRTNMKPIPAEIQAIQFDNLNSVFMVLGLVQQNK